MQMFLVIAVPLIIVFFSIKNRKLNFDGITLGLTFAFIPLAVWAALMYWIERSTSLHTGWSFYTILSIFTPYILVLTILNTIRIIMMVLRNRGK